MKDFNVTNFNHDEIQVRYVDSIISRMDFMQIRSLLKDYLHSEKDRYSNEDLADEIKSRNPEVCKDVFGIYYRTKKESESLT
jgi:hypothetical protein